MITLVTNIENSHFEEALTKTMAQKVVFIYEYPADRDKFETLFSDLDLSEDHEREYHHQPLDDLKIASEQLRKILSIAFNESSDIYFALKPGALGLQILQTAQQFDIKSIKRIYVIQGDKLDDFKACVW
ncbi:hypothetical protein [Methanobacterium petrolearium]|uniref:hypothetical protein n=1 Tax=Methanobacterium petrolearium TaxID=710190 RepID=UPI001AE37B44|nr:hypothetical protein [Methanobacterium petrolearium]MBP1945421.1 hypothetical protein [Methanobacterium petrolearium]BDZ71618.1 hypothetical protein GCM10025861_21350 [Methanobacterium petrolearium]